MTDKKKRGSSRRKLGRRPGELAAHKLGILEHVIAAVQKAHDEYVLGVKEGTNKLHRCSVQLIGCDATYLLRCLKAVQNRDDDPFGIDGAFRVNCGPSLPEQAAMAREVQAEVDSGKAITVTEALQYVSVRRSISVEKLKAIYYDLKDAI